MKKLILLAGFLICAMTLNAQNIYNSNGNLTSPRTLTLGSYYLHFKPLSGTGLYLHPTGSVGVGTQYPSQKLEVLGGIKAEGVILTKSAPNGSVFTSSGDRVNKTGVIMAGTLLSPSSGARTFQFFDFPISNMNDVETVWFSIQDRGYKDRLRFYAELGKESHFTLFDKNQATNFAVSDDGNSNITAVMPKQNSYLGIGTNVFTDGTDSYKLSVNGNIRAHRVKVYTSWADYVFDEDYCLPSLEEVEEHIVEKGHLIDIPSAVEVETNGIELGEMNKLLLQKIEELTLYTIQLNKEVQYLKSQLNK